MKKVEKSSSAGTKVESSTNVDVNSVRQPIANPNVGRSLLVKDVKKGFKYQAWVGYEWQQMEYPMTGFNREQLVKLIKGKSSLIQSV